MFMLIVNMNTGNRQELRMTTLPHAPTRVALVTGAANGIGAAIARGHVATGGTCILTDVQDGRGQALADELGERASYRHLDVTDADAFTAVVDDAATEHGRIDTLFSNAGVTGVTGSIASTDPEAWRETLDVLLTSTFLGIRAVTPHLSAQGSGSVVCTASVASLRGGLGPHAYTAAKHGVWGLVQSVAAEYAGLGLRINCVAPGPVVTALAARLAAGDADALGLAHERLAARSRAGTPTLAADVADAALYLAGEGARRVNGTCLVIDGGEEVISDRALPFMT